jgi:single-stranded-DNA-specific exonuclease
MISVTHKKWEEKKTNKNLIKKLKQEHNFSEIISKLLISRNFDEDEIYSIKDNLVLNNVFSNNKDFNQAITLVLDSIYKDEIICILGDYDVDGSASTALFVKFLESIDHPFFFYIPDREKDGYGPSIKLFKKLLLKKPKLVIMLDCGSTSNDAINFLKEFGIKSLIIDHHEINKPYPDANVIINPKKNNGYEKFNYLCATTLVYFFLDLLLKMKKSKFVLRDYLIYVLLATVCDVMPLRKLNRIISLCALKEFNIKKNYAFKEIFSICNKKNKITIEDLGFLVGPILNSGGRLGKSKYATELLSSNNIKVINKRTVELIKLNNQRKNIETLILNEINFDNIEKENKSIIIYFNPNINEGLIGIIAARLKDYFNKPSIVITSSGKILKGSARSTSGYNIGKAIKYSIDANISLNGGGHSMAAGFTLEKKNLQIFNNFMLKNFLKLNKSTNNVFYYDSIISSTGFNKYFFEEIKKIKPFGTANPVPTFLFKNLKIIKTKILKKKHISCIFKSKIGFSINSVSFNSVNSKLGSYLLNYKKELNVVGQINENFWNNKNSLQLTIRDLIV